MGSVIRDISLAKSGRQKINWVRKNMPLLRSLRKSSQKQSLLTE